MNKIWSYDIEIFPNYFSAIFIDIEEYLKIYDAIRDDKGNLIISESEKIKRIKEVPHYLFEISSINGYEKCDILDLLSFINQGDYLCGFNILNYDNTILNMLSIELNKFKDTKDINKKLYKLSQKLVNTDFEILRNDDTVKLYKFLKTNYKSIDIQRIPALDRIFKSLKQTLINISWFSINDFHLPPIDEDKEGHFYTDVQLNNKKYINDWDRYLIKEHIENLIIYNRNDVLGVAELFGFLKKQILLRFNISAKYDINVMSASDSRIADIFISKYYSDYTGLDYKEFKDLRTHRGRMKIGKIISPLVHFDTVVFNDLLHKLLTTTVSSTNEIDFPITFNGVTFDIKSGGLHSRDIPGEFKNIEDKDNYIKDQDYASYYPNLMRNLLIAPKHLDKEIFLQIIDVIIEERLKAKAEGNMVDAQVLKISINATYGKMNFAFSFLFDTLGTLTTTINGQLYLLMLVEKLALVGIKTISANTDGIICHIPKDKLDIYYKVCDDFAKYINIGIEYTDYVKYFRLDVNNYITVKKKKDGSLDVKRKGRLNQHLCTEDLRKGFAKPIIAKAVEEYFINDIPVGDTISNERNIYLFCATQNMNSDFTPTFRTMHKGVFKEETLQKNIRYFISNKGGLLLKKKGEGNEASYTNVATGLYTTIFNEYFEVDSFKDYDVNYKHYILEAKKLITTIESGIKGKRKKDKDKQSNRFMGSLFDDAEFSNHEITRKEESLEICDANKRAYVPADNLTEEEEVDRDMKPFDNNMEGEFPIQTWENKPLTEEEVNMLNETNEENRNSHSSPFTGDLMNSDDLPF